MTLRDFIKAIRIGYDASNQNELVRELIEAWTHSENTSGLDDGAISQWLSRDRGYKRTIKNLTKDFPIDDDAFISFLLFRTHTTWRNVQNAFKSDNEYDIIKCETADKEEFWYSVLCQFKSMVGIPWGGEYTGEKPDNISLNNIIHNADEYFLLRIENKDVFDLINERFEACNSEPKILMVYGHHGIGKTRTIKEYSRSKFAQNCKIVRLLYAESEQNLRDSASGFLNEWGNQTQKNSDDISGAFRNWFHEKTSGQFLLIFEDVEDFSLVRPYLPKSPNGRIILTAEKADLSNYQGELLEIVCLDPVTARKYLRHNTQSEDTSNADELAERLGYFPLALELASAFLRSRSKKEFVGFPEYLQLLDDILPNYKSSGNGKSDYREICDAALTVALDRGLSTCARHFVSICSHLSPHDVNVILEAGCYDALPAELRDVFIDEYMKDKIITELTGYALTKDRMDIQSKRILSVPRLLYELIREKKSEEYNYAEIAKDLLIRKARASGIHSRGATQVNP